MNGILGLLISAVVPFLITKFGGMGISALLLKVGAGQALGAIEEIARKIAGKKPLTDSERLTWNSHLQTNYQQPQQQSKPVEVSGSPGVPFQRV